MVSNPTWRTSGWSKFSDFNCPPIGVCFLQPNVNVVPAEFETELAALKEKLLLMAGYAEAAVNRAVKALIRRAVGS